MPEIEVTEAQRERLAALQEELADEVVGKYGHVRAQDAVEYLLDRYADDEGHGADHDQAAGATAAEDGSVSGGGDRSGSGTGGPAAPADDLADAVVGAGVGGSDGTTTVRRAGESEPSTAAAEDVDEAVQAATSGESPGEVDPDDDDGDGDTEGETDAPEEDDQADDDDEAADDDEEAADDDEDEADDDEEAADDEDEADDDEDEDADDGEDEDADDDEDEDDEAESGGGGSSGAGGGTSSTLNAMMNLLSAHDDKWREASGDARYEVDLPDGNVESARTKDDVRALLFKHYR